MKLHIPLNSKKNHSSYALRHSLAKGFTLIELLIVVGIIAALAVTVFVVLNPAKRLADSRDSRRIADVESILNAVHSYILDNKGSLPSSITGDTAGTDYELGTASGASCIALTQNNCTVSLGNCDNLGSDLTKYFKSFPLDPKTGTAALTGYVINIDANNIVTIKACLGENNTAIQISR